MTDLREPEPALVTFDVEGPGCTRFEFEIAAWPYHGMSNDKVIARSLVYRTHCDSFREAYRMAMLARDTVQAVHDVWQARIVRIQERRP